MKHEVLEEIFARLRNAGWLREDLASVDASDLVVKALFAPDTSILAGTRVTSIIEFGRIVHAEMSAITDAARRGLSVRGATLYCTTFPCHMCARHIISSGIKRVVYIEPYPKSMAKELYKGSLDAMTILKLPMMQWSFDHLLAYHHDDTYSFLKCPCGRTNEAM